MDVTTDRSVDCHSLKSIVAGVCRSGMTAQAKAVALFQFARRLMFHYPNRADPAAVHDTLRLLNTYGYAFCSQQALLTVHLWQAAGIRGYVWSVPGHSTAQAEYGGGHHWFDPLIGAYVYRRDGRTIASLQDIAADAAVLTQAVRERRGGAGMVPCRTALRDDPARFSRHNPRYIRECAELVDDVGFMAALAPEAGEWKWGEPPRSRYRPGWTLRRGERVVFLWDCLPDQANCMVLKPTDRPRAYFVTPADLPPFHFCGAQAERRDVNWRFFSPYVKTIQGVRTGRYAANGRHVYRPDLACPAAGGDLEVNTFRAGSAGAAGPALRVARRGRPSRLVFRMHTPHVYTGGTLSARFRRGAAGDVSRIFVRCGRQERWVKVWDAGRAAPGKLRAQVELKDHVRGARDVWFRLDCATRGDTGRAGLDAVEVRAVFQHNMFARPYLVAGRNRVTVRAGKRELSKAGPLKVIYTWKQGRARRRHVREVAASPTTYTINVGGRDMPRMLSLELAAAP